MLLLLLWVTAMRGGAGLLLLRLLVVGGGSLRRAVQCPAAHCGVRHGAAAAAGVGTGRSAKQVIHHSRGHSGRRDLLMRVLLLLLLLLLRQRRRCWCWLLVVLAVGRLLLLLRLLLAVRLRGRLQRGCRRRLLVLLKIGVLMGGSGRGGGALTRLRQLLVLPVLLGVRRGMLVLLVLLRVCIGLLVLVLLRSAGSCGRRARVRPRAGTATTAWATPLLH